MENQEHQPVEFENQELSKSMEAPLEENPEKKEGKIFFKFF